jgi:2-aminoethylphosphonate-pyruvate transaminase
MDKDFFCPGPVNIEESVKKEILNLSSHRSKEFISLLEECYHNTLKLFNVNNYYDENGDNIYSALFLTGSGTLSIESMIYSYLKYKKVLILSNGFFGERWYDMINNYSSNFKYLKFEWNNEFDYSLIESELENNYDILFFVHHETSTTMINDIEILNNICKKKNTNIVIDAVSSVGIYNIDLKKYDMLIGLGFSSNKCIGSYPGLSIVVFKTYDLKNMPKNISYLNLYNYYEYMKIFQTPYTPCIQNFYAYNLSLKNVLNKTYNVKLYYDDLMVYFKQKLLEKNLVPVLKTNQCNWVINILYENPNYIYNKLYNENIIIYKCKNSLQDIAIQIALFNKTYRDIDNLIKLL